MAGKSENLALSIARDAMDRYSRSATDQVMVDHRQAMDCRNCEAFLQLGINTYEWLMRADSAYRQGVYDDPSNYDPEVDGVIKEALQGWLNQSERAADWIATQQKRGYCVDNLAEFKAVCEQVRSIVESFDDDVRGIKVMGANLIVLRDQALAEPYDQAAEIF